MQEDELFQATTVCFWGASLRQSSLVQFLVCIRAVPWINQSGWMSADTLCSKQGQFEEVALGCFQVGFYCL